MLLIGQIPPKAPVVPLTLIAHYWLVQETDSSVILNLTKLNTDSFIHILGLNSVFVKPPKSVWSKWSKCSAMCGYNGRRIRILTCFYGNHNYNCARRESCVSPSCSSTGEHLNIPKKFKTHRPIAIRKLVPFVTRTKLW
mgnify:CR=1 FL=1